MHKILFVLTMLLPGYLSAQEDLLKMLDKETPKTKAYTIGVFKGTLIVNGQSTEQPGKGVIQFMISHRFGRIGGSIKEFFGLDYSTIRLGLEYGILDNLEVGVGRSSYQKTVDGFIKWRIIRQQTGKWNVPITISAYTSMAIRTDDWADPARPNFFTSRMYYSYQLLISRKFGSWLSLQVMPTLVHRNIVTTVKDHNDVFSIGAAASVKLTRNLRLNGEYYFIIPHQVVSKIGGEKVRDCLSLGIDIETGGHVFQVHLTNSRGMIEKNFAAETTGNWFPKLWKDFGVQLGFNISRTFNTGKHKGVKKEKKEMAKPGKGE